MLLVLISMKMFIKIVSGTASKNIEITKLSNVLVTLFIKCIFKNYVFWINYKLFPIYCSSGAAEGVPERVPPFPPSAPPTLFHTHTHTHTHTETHTHTHTQNFTEMEL